MSEPLPLDLHIPTRPATNPDGPMPTVPGVLVARLVIRGRPAPQGSKRWLGLSPNGKQRFAEDSDKVGSWRADVQAAAGAFITAREEETGRRWTAIDAPIALSCVFYFARPLSHYRTGRNAHLLRGSAPMWPTSPPDTSKLVRSTEDAITDSGLWRDDARVVEYRPPFGKAYSTGGTAGALIQIWCLDQTSPAEGTR